MDHYAHGWIGTLAGMLDMEEEHCRENLRHYESGPDHDTYAAFLADVLELRKRLRLYDAAPELLAACRAMLASSGLIGNYPDVWKAVAQMRTAIAKAEGRTE